MTFQFEAVCHVCVLAIVLSFQLWRELSWYTIETVTSYHAVVLVYLHALSRSVHF